VITVGRRLPKLTQIPRPTIRNLRWWVGYERGGEVESFDLGLPQTSVFLIDPFKPPYIGFSQLGLPALSDLSGRQP